jgi:hypothetical protein
VHHLPLGTEQPKAARVSGINRSLGGAETAPFRSLNGDPTRHNLTLKELKSRQADLG